MWSDLIMQASPKHGVGNIKVLLVAGKHHIISFPLL